jgi:hypothetical protein
MRIYCDSNIFRKIKQGSSQFNETVYLTMESLQPHFLFLFSEAHLWDLSKSSESYRNQDLQAMEVYVKNNYISRDHIKKQLHFYLATPAEAYEGMDFQASSDFLQDPYEGFNSLFDFEGGEQLGTIFKGLFDLPIMPDINIDTSMLQPEHREMAEQFKGVRSINDALKKMKGVGDLLDSNSAFKKHRSMLSTYLDRDEYSYDEWSFDFDQRMKETAFGKSFTELVEEMTPQADRNDRYTNFINTYVQLDFFGITEERSGSKQKLKKNSHMDLNKDAMHVFFASHTDYFVTDDIGVQTKAFILYRLFNVNTQVLSVKDFIARSFLLIKNEDSNATFVQGLSFSLKQGFVVNQSLLKQQTVIKTLYPTFNYFNRVQINAEKDQKNVQLFQYIENPNGVMYAEIELLIDKAERVFGKSIDLKGKAHLGEFLSQEIGTPIRTWKLNKGEITLSWEKNDVDRPIIVLTIWI